MSWLTIVHAISLVVLVSFTIAANGAPAENLIVLQNGPKTTLAPSAAGSGGPVRMSIITTPAPLNLKLVIGDKTGLSGHVVTTGAPIAAANTVAVKVVANGTALGTTLKPASNGVVAIVEAATTPAQRVSQYFEPICSQLDRLELKQMFKIQSQMKQFVDKTAGKMSLCFMQQYSMDPNLTPISKPQLQTICSSRNLEQNAKGSFKAFLDCAGRNYGPALDAELARINKSRVNCATNHEHSKNDTLSSLTHDDDELSIISEVVNKVMSDSQNGSFKTDLKVFELDGAKPASVANGVPMTTLTEIKVASATTHAPSLASKIKPTDSATNKRLMNDPNTMVLFVDDSVGNITTVAPVKTSVVVAHTTAAPKEVIRLSVAPAKSSAAPTAVTEKIVVTVASTAKPVAHNVSTTASAANITLVPAKPTASSNTTTKPATLGEKIVATVSVKSTVAPAASGKNSTSIDISIKTTNATSTTPAPKATEAKNTTTIAPTTIAPTKQASTSVKPAAAETTKKPEGSSTAKPAESVAGTSSTMKPLKALKNVLEKQEQEKAELDSKLKKEREKVFKETEKKQDDLDAKKAIKALQKQRADAHGGPADARMHQIEHERQMSIDPVGHTIKHQEYEMSKQKKAAAAAAAAVAPSADSTKSTSTTKKPQ